MKVMICNKYGRIINFKNDNDKEFEGYTYQPITSYASDIDMEDVTNNEAWKFKIVDGELQYDQEKIQAKLAKDIDTKRELEYATKVDKLVIEKIRKQLKDPEIDAIVSQIHVKYPK